MRYVAAELTILSAVGLSIYFLIFLIENILKLVLLHNLAMCASRQHVESNVTARFLGDYHLERSTHHWPWSIYLIVYFFTCCDNKKFSLSSFNFNKNIALIHIRIPATRVSDGDIASYLAVTSDGLTAIEVSIISIEVCTPILLDNFAKGTCGVVKCTGLMTKSGETPNSRFWFRDKDHIFTEWMQCFRHDKTNWEGLHLCHNMYQEGFNAYYLLGYIQDTNHVRTKSIGLALMSLTHWSLAIPHSIMGLRLPI